MQIKADFLAGVSLISLLLFGALFGTPTLAAPPSPEAVKATDIVQTMRAAMEQNNYRGTIAYLKEGRIDTLELVHVMQPEGVYERIVSLNGSMREVIRENGRINVYSPENHTVITENEVGKRYFLLDFPADISSLDERYAIKIAGQETVIHRTAWIISIDPLDDLRYGRRIWIDSETRLPIKYELIDEHHQIVEQMMFTTLDLKPDINMKTLRSLSHHEGYKSVVATSENLPLEKLNWTFSAVPAGYQIKSYAKVQRPPLNHPIEHIMLSDGLSSVSIYIDQAVEKLPVGHAKKIGGINAYIRTSNHYQLTTLGEVPAKAVELIGNGMQFRGQP